jgi:hypothetical protein
MVSRRLMQRFVQSWVCGVSCACGVVGFAAETQPSAATVWEQLGIDGQAYQAVVLPPTSSPNAVVAHQHVVLVDTSASQMGEHRRQALKVLDQFLANLPEGHRVRLFAVDVKPMALTTEFVAPGSPAMTKAVSQLQRRVPLGATDLVAGLEIALNSIPQGQSGSVVYLGDGQATARVFTHEKFSELTAICRQRQIPVSSYSVGPMLNLRLLGALALQTGGSVLYDDLSSNGDGNAVQPSNQSSSSHGTRLAQVASAAVYFPTLLQQKSSDKPGEWKLLPDVALPVRSDRETIYLSQGAVPVGTTIALFTPGQGKLEWTLSNPVEASGTTVLPVYAERAVADQGLSNGLAGLPMLRLAEDEFQGHLLGLLQQGQQALTERNPETAARVAEHVRRLDANSIEAKTLLAQADQLQTATVSRRQPVDDAPAEAGSGLPEAEVPSSGDLIADREAKIRVKTQQLQQRVSIAIESSRAATEPEAAIDELKRTANTVRSSLDIAPEDRAKLLKQVEGELLAATVRSEKLSLVRSRMQERLATQESQDRLNEQLLLDEERMANLIDRVRALMSAGRHGDDAAYGDAQQVADVAVNLRPGDGTAAAARFDSEAAEQLNRAFRLRAKRADQFLETLHQVELSHVPFPDEPPVRFPPPEVWNALTQRRKKYSSTDLRNNSASEQRIEAALSDFTELNFTETPLQDALDLLSDLHNIQIYVDEAAITEAGGDISKPVTLELSGITLRSALKLLLEPDLTYAIEDDVMKITSAVEAEEALSVRVYPVGDLAVSPEAMRGAVAGGMGGLGGGMMGGGMGGMGGGMMGGGMGGMGGGMGGMGGGMFSVPAQPIPASPKKKLP